MTDVTMECHVSRALIYIMWPRLEQLRLEPLSTCDTPETGADSVQTAPAMPRLYAVPLSGGPGGGGGYVLLRVLES